MNNTGRESGPFFMNDAIYLFRGEHAFLSNYYPARVVDCAIEYPSAEHAFQASKTWDVETRIAISKLGVGVNPKDVGLKIVVREDWFAVQVKELERITLDKYMRNPSLAIKLMETGTDQFLKGQRGMIGFGE